MRRVLPALLSMSVATSAVGQTSEDRPTIWSLLTAERFVTALAQQGLFYSRLVADVRYDTITVDPIGSTLQLGGLHVAPKMPYGDADACVITAARATVQGNALDTVENGRLSIGLDQAKVSFDCFPQEIRPVVGLLGIGDLLIDRIDLTGAYNYPDGSVRLSMQAGVDGLVTLTGDAEIDYVSLRMDFTDSNPEPEPAADIRHIRFQVEDAGLSEKLEQILPPLMRDPETLAAQVGAGLTQALAEMGPLGAAQERFVSEATDMARAVANGADRIVLETAIDGAAVRVNEAAMDNPAEVFAALAPRIGAASTRLIAAVPTALLNKAFEGSLQTDEALLVGRALLTGEGAPRNVAVGLEVLKPLVDAGHPEAAGLGAEALLGQDAEAAYALALSAAAAGNANAVAVADKAELELPLAAVLSAQELAITPDLSAANRFETVAGMRGAAQSHLIGLSTPRSFALSYYWATLAAAAGDSAGAGIRDRLDERMRVRGLAKEWATFAADVESAALRTWIAADLPTTLLAD